MKFYLKEIRIWFRNNHKPKSFEFLPNKINVVTGDSNTGKSSFLSIIDYCLLSHKSNMVEEIINENVDWYGISLMLDDKDYCIARKSPKKATVSSELFFLEGSVFPENPYSNRDINDVKTLLDKSFGITDELRFPFGKEGGATDFLLSYRYFLLFNCLTEDIIGTSKKYFDTDLFGKEEYEKALKDIFLMIIGVNNMRNIKAKERIKEIEEEIRKINYKYRKTENEENIYSRDIDNLVSECKNHNLIRLDETYISTEAALDALNSIITEYKQLASSEKVFNEIDVLNKKKITIRYRINSIQKFKKEYDEYRKNLNSYADSLKPIEYLNANYFNIIQSYETKAFLDVLEKSLKTIKESYSPNKIESFAFSAQLKELQKELEAIESQIKLLPAIKKPFSSEASKYIFIGEIKSALANLMIHKKVKKQIDSNVLNDYNTELNTLKDIPGDSEELKFVMTTELNKSIKRNFDQITSMVTYQNYDVNFSIEDMILKLKKPTELWAIENIGSKSNYMFLHLCFFLGLHEHMINVGQDHVPQFLFIDQPSIPYYSGGNTLMSNNDKIKLLDAFKLLNSFIDYVVGEKKKDFQIFMVEHAPKEYWLDNGFKNFHTVAEFINGNALIPHDVYTKEIEYESIN